TAVSGCSSRAVSSVKLDAGLFDELPDELPDGLTLLVPRGCASFSIFFSIFFCTRPGRRICAAASVAGMTNAKNSVARTHAKIQALLPTFDPIVLSWGSIMITVLLPIILHTRPHRRTAGCFDFAGWPAQSPISGWP